MVKNLRLQKYNKIEDKIVKNLINLFILKKKKKKKEKVDDTIRHKKSFQIERNEAIKDRGRKDISIEHEEEKHYYKPVRVGNSWSNNYVEYESNGDRNKTLSIE